MNERLDRWLQDDDRMGLAVAVIALVVYVTTMNRTLSFIDSGELATVAVTLGIAHPTGYPLFTLLGRLASLLPGGEAILRLNGMAALLVALAAGMLVKVSVLLGTTLRSPARKGSKSFLVPAAAVGALVFAFSTTVWSESAAVEVYSLHLLLLMIIFYAFVRGVVETREEKPLSRWLLLFAFSLGLSFTNHMTTLLLAPAFLYLFFSVHRIRRWSLKVIAVLAPWFLAGLSLYLYLPLRSSQGPVLDWGHPAELERFLWHVSGKQYRSWIFSSMASAEKQFNYFIHHVPSEFGWILLIILAFGVWTLLWEHRRLFVFVSLLVVGCLAYAVNYDIHDIDSYFLLAYIGAAFFIVFGLERILVMAAGKKWSPLLLLTALALPIVQWAGHRAMVDESDNRLVDNYTTTILQQVDSNAVVLTYQWDYFVSASYYAQYVRHQRPDVCVIDKELLRRSWYILQLQRNHPALMARSREKIDAFLKAVYRFEHDMPYNGAVIEKAFNEMINDIIGKSALDRPVYLGPEMGQQFGSAFQRVPEGLLFRLRPIGSEMKLRPLTIRFEPTTYQSDLTRGLAFQYARMLTLRAVLLRNQGKTDEAREWARKVREIDPEYPADSFQPAER